MKVSNIHSEKTTARRTCDNGRCAETRDLWKITVRLGEDEGVETGNGPQTVVTFACDKHKVWLLRQYAMEGNS
jgi:hypothetical protein